MKNPTTSNLARAMLTSMGVPWRTTNTCGYVGRPARSAASTLHRRRDRGLPSRIGSALSWLASATAEGSQPKTWVMGVMGGQGLALAVVRRVVARHQGIRLCPSLHPAQATA